MSVTSVRLKDELQVQLEQAAERLDRPKSWIINEAVASWLEQEESRARMYRETLEGLADVEAGRVVDGEEVLAWIQSWGTENELPCPAVPSGTAVSPGTTVPEGTVPGPSEGS